MLEPLQILNIDRPTVKFTQVSNAFLDDDRLNGNAKHLMTILIRIGKLKYLNPNSLPKLKKRNPDGTETPYLPQKRGWGVKSIYGMLNEMRRYGYAQVVYRYDIKTGKRLPSTWIIYTTPRENTTADVFEAMLLKNGEWTITSRHVTKNIRWKNDPTTEGGVFAKEAYESTFDELMKRLIADAAETKRLFDKHASFLTQPMLDAYRIKFKANRAAHAHGDDYTGFCDHFANYIHKMYFEVEPREDYRKRQAAKAAMAAQATNANAAAAPGPHTHNAAMVALETRWAIIQSADDAQKYQWFKEQCQLFVKEARKDFTPLSIEMRGRVEELEDKLKRTEAVGGVLKAWLLEIIDRNTRANAPPPPKLTDIPILIVD
jgi:hypothetical protein